MGTILAVTCPSVHVCLIFSYPDYSTKEGIQMTKTSILPKLYCSSERLICSEFIFSDKYLTADKFLRQSMNAEGYFPILLLFYLPVIQSYGVTAEFLAEVLGESEFADVDLSQMTVRPKNWQKVLARRGLISSGSYRLQLRKRWSLRFLWQPNNEFNLASCLLH